MSAAVAFAPSIVNRGVHLHPLSLNNAPTKALVGASLKGYSLHCIIFGTATEMAISVLIKEFSAPQTLKIA